MCLIGIMATFGWEKALGDADELAWWQNAAAGAAARRGIATDGSADDSRLLRAFRAGLGAGR